MACRRAQFIAEYNEFYKKGMDLCRRAMKTEEIFREGKDKQKLVEACELYKGAVLEFKLAVHIADTKLAENDHRKLGVSSDKMEGVLNSTQERFQFLVTELECLESCEKEGSSQYRYVMRKVSRSALLRNVDQKLGNRLLDEILLNTGVRLVDVAGCSSAKSALEEAVILPSMNPELFKGLRQPVKGILLFGPPGNGKTMLAKAVANDSGQLFFNISAASLTSKWVGDGEKTIRSLFQIARNAQPCIIFIDEIDSILCQRSESDSDNARRLKTEFLVQFDGASTNSNERILVIGATNRPHELDDAVLRRFPKRIMLSLPDDAERNTLVISILQKHGLIDGLDYNAIRYIASRTSGYSYSDLVALCKEASMMPVRDIDVSKIANVDSSSIRQLKRSDFDKALTVVRPSTNTKILDELTQFAQKSGQMY